MFDSRGELQQQAVVFAVDDAESFAKCQFVGRLPVDAVYDVTRSDTERFGLAARFHLQHGKPL